MIKKLVLEFTRTDILNGVDPNFIQHKKYTNDLKNKVGKINLNSNSWYIDKVDGSKIYIKIRSAKDNKLFYLNIIQLDDYEWLRNSFKFKDYDMKNENDKKKLVYDLKDIFNEMIVKQNIQTSCSCPSALYFGYKFIGTQLDYQVKRDKENRSPDIRNPDQKGTVCKHLHITLDYINNKEVKEFVIECLINSFLLREIRRRYGYIKQSFWRKWFKNQNLK
jgi:hypothetical protein